MKKIIFMFCSLLPLCLQIPYLLSAWRFSRLDQWDALFYLLAVPAAAYAVRKAEISHWDRRALFPAVPLLLLTLGLGNLDAAGPGVSERLGIRPTHLPSPPPRSSSLRRSGWLHPGLSPTVFCPQF